jgi:SPP1 gp7 family putative phage head morphogenesis protein
MPTANSLLNDGLISHQIGLSRLSSSTITQLISELKVAHEEVTNQIAGRMARRAKLGKETGPEVVRRLRELERSIKATLTEAWAVQKKTLGSGFSGLAQYEVDYMINLLNKSTPLAVGWTRPSKELLESIVKFQPVEGKLIGEYMKKLGTDELAAVTGAVRTGMLLGESTDMIIDRVDKAFDVSYRHAASWIRTATNEVSNSARKTLYAANTDVVKATQWVSTLDLRTTPICQALDGETWTLNPAGGYKVGSYGHPTPPGPPAHFNCRSTLAPVLKSWKELGLKDPPPGTRASMDGQVPATETYRDFLNRKIKTDRPAVDKLLGKKRAAFYAANPDMDLHRFMRPDGLEPLTLDELARVEGVKIPKDVAARRGPAPPSLDEQDLMRRIDNLPDDFKVMFESDAKAFSAAVSDDFPGQDMIHRRLALNQKGFTDAPAVLTDDAFDTLDSPSFWQGIRGADDPLEKFAKGDYYSQNGSHGAGFQFWSREQTAQAFGSTVEARLLPGARLAAKADVDDWARALRKLADRTNEFADDLAFQYRSLSHVAVREAKERARMLSAIAEDRGRTATFFGYDGLVTKVGQVEIRVISNRSKLAVRKTAFDDRFPAKLRWPDHLPEEIWGGDRHFGGNYEYFRRHWSQFDDKVKDLPEGGVKAAQQKVSLFLKRKVESGPEGKAAKWYWDEYADDATKLYLKELNEVRKREDLARLFPAEVLEGVEKGLKNVERRALSTGELTGSDTLPQTTFNKVQRVVFRDPVTGQRVQGVFKAGDFDNPNNPLYRSTIGVSGGNMADREILAYQLDELFDLNLVPTTVRRTIDGKPGTVQAWVPGDPIHKAWGGWGQTPSDAPRQQMIDMTMFDFVLGNFDRHGGNALIEKTADGWNLHAIDHGFSACSGQMAPIRKVRQEVTKQWWGKSVWVGNEPRLSRNAVKLTKAERDRWIKMLEDPRLPELFYASGIDAEAAAAAIDRIDFLLDKLYSNTFTDWFVLDYAEGFEII